LVAGADYKGERDEKGKVIKKPATEVAGSSIQGDGLHF
jgi:hypothetical protein